MLINVLDWFMSAGQEVMLQELGGGRRGTEHSHVLRTQRDWKFCRRSKEQSGEIQDKMKKKPGRTKLNNCLVYPYHIYCTFLFAIARKDSKPVHALGIFCNTLYVMNCFSYNSIYSIV